MALDWTPDDDMPVAAWDDWTLRVTPLLTADDPHQACNARARAEGVLSVDEVCTCGLRETKPCTNSCCVRPTEEW